VSAGDVQAIKRLKSRYFRLMDAKRWDEWRGLFADDATFDVQGRPTIEGADAWVASVSGGLGPGVSVHQGHMPEIEVTGPGAARGVWAMASYIELPSDGEPRSGWQNYGHYTDEYRRVGGDWRIASLRLTRLRSDSLHGARPEDVETLRLRPEPADEGTGDPSEDELADLEAIAALKSRYFRLLDTKDWNGWRDLFSDDARFELLGVDGDVSTVDAFVDTVSRNLAATVTVHHGHMPDLRLLGPGRARGIWALNDYVEWPAAGSGIRGFGHYEEEYAKQAGEWRISSLRLSYLRIDPFAHEPWTPPPLPRVSGDWLAGGSPPLAAQLADVEAIRQLKARYFRLLDEKRWDELAGVFTGDVRVSTPRMGDATEDLDTFVASLQRNLDGVVTVHHGHMPEVVFTGPGTARGVWALFDYLEWPDGGVYQGYGHYEEEYRREGGEWRIASLRLSRLREDRTG
jgi:3-phenylpropionate/cinnamic acid dioxygenase small subunit